MKSHLPNPQSDGKMILYLKEPEGDLALAGKEKNRINCIPTELPATGDSRAQS